MKAKLISSLIAVPVVVGAIVFANFGDLMQGKEIVETLFLCFFGAVITMQLVPALFLLQVLVREVWHTEPKVKEEHGASVER